VGDSSYSLYLTHIITLAAVAAVWTRQSVIHGPILFSVACLAAAIAVAILCYHLIERPVTSALKRVSFRTAAVQRLSAASSSGAGDPL
jgi:exopolysaccharide production protein ExoZ